MYTSLDHQDRIAARVFFHEPIYLLLNISF